MLFSGGDRHVLHQEQISLGNLVRRGYMLHRECLCYFGEHLILDLFGDPGGPELIRALNSDILAAMPVRDALTSVSTAPGATTFTRMGARSMANPRASASTEPSALAITDHCFRGFIKAPPMVIRMRLG